jgi:hypothetical protein
LLQRSRTRPAMAFWRDFAGGVNMSSHSVALDYDGAAGSNVIRYSREYVPNDKEVAPYALTGLKRFVFLVMYGLIVSLSFGGIAYTFYVSPLFALIILPVCYVSNNLLFLAGHHKFHTSFIEMPESKMSILVHHSLIHHYRNIRVYHETWLETRTSYFIDARSLFDKTFRCYVLFIPLTSVILYKIAPVLGIAYLSSQYLAELLQSTVHEWYHNPARNRKTFYTFPVYWFFVLLEKTGLASTKRHAMHHGHQLHDLDKVEVWLDLYIPFGEMLASRFWKKVLTKYVPGKTYMTEFVERAGFLFAFAVLAVIDPAIYAFVFLKLLK